MNTEELEKSLRAEFEGQMTSALAKMRADVADLQMHYEGEAEKHRAQMNEAFRALSEKLDAPFEFDQAFGESVVEHLRLARDEGAEITAMAMGEAEKLSSNGAAVHGGNHDVENLRDAIYDIKANSTQASILRALVDAAANFAPRGTFFIVKNEHLVGWKVFGKGELPDENVVRGIHFPVAAETLVSDAVTSLANVKGSYADQNDNAKFLGPLAFGAPNNMYAFPLCARGRGVAVLYVDGGDGDENVNVEALETLVTVAGLRVELLANATLPSPEKQIEDTPAEAPIYQEVSPVAVEASAVEEKPADPVEEPVQAVVADVQEEIVAEEIVAEEVNEVEYVGDVDVSQNGSAPVPEFEIERSGVQEAEAALEQEAPNEFAFSSNNFSDDAPVVEPEAKVEPEVVEAVEVQADPVSQTVKSYRERSVDLPIEVSEDERRPHSDARRFARLLVSEIRLYNEQKVLEGRESGDIYDLLREAIDRSREMYEKRVQPDVAAKFDYFHYELVNNLAEGDEEKLGAGYLAVRA